MEYKRILIISNSFYPVVSPRSYRATELAKEFAGRGHAVKIITSFKDGVDYENWLLLLKYNSEILER